MENKGGENLNASNDALLICGTAFLLFCGVRSVLLLNLGYYFMFKSYEVNKKFKSMCMDIW